MSSVIFFIVIVWRVNWKHYWDFFFLIEERYLLICEAWDVEPEPKLFCHILQTEMYCSAICCRFCLVFFHSEAHREFAHGETTKWCRLWARIRGCCSWIENIARQKNISLGFCRGVSYHFRLLNHGVRNISNWLCLDLKAVCFLSNRSIAARQC